MSLPWQRTQVESGVLLSRKVIQVGDAQGHDGGFSDAPEHVPQEDVDPQVGARLLLTRRLVLRRGGCLRYAQAVVGHAGQDGLCRVHLGKVLDARLILVPEGNGHHRRVV